jgi:hypothetical protein
MYYSQNQYLKRSRGSIADSEGRKSYSKGTIGKSLSSRMKHRLTSSIVYLIFCPNLSPKMSRNVSISSFTSFDSSNFLKQICKFSTRPWRSRSNSFIVNICVSSRIFMVKFINFQLINLNSRIILMRKKENRGAQVWEVSGYSQAPNSTRLTIDHLYSPQLKDAGQRPLLSVTRHSAMRLVDFEEGFMILPLKLQ